MSGELATERWTPARRVESVLLSILLLLNDAECSSPANVDAGVMLRNQPDEYRRRVAEDVAASKKDIPDGFVVPEADVPPPPEKHHDDRDFWYDSDPDDEFGGSDTDEADAQGEPEDEEDEEDEEEEDDTGGHYEEHEEEEEL